MHLTPNSKNHKRLCILCDSDSINDTSFESTVLSLALDMVEAKIGLVYGGKTCDLMDTMAQTIKDYGGHVTGVVSTYHQEKKLGFKNYDERYETHNFHESKMLIYKLSSGIVALPGGINTLDILMEYLTWMQRGLEPKPVYIVNNKGFWNSLLQMFDHMQAESFLPDDFKERYILKQNAKNIVSDFKKRTDGDAIWKI